MEIIKNVAAVICIAFIIINAIMLFYQFVRDNDRKHRLQVGTAIIAQIMILYGGYIIISFFNS